MYPNWERGQALKKTKCHAVVAFRERLFFRHAGGRAVFRSLSSGFAAGVPRPSFPARRLLSPRPAPRTGSPPPPLRPVPRVLPSRCSLAKAFPAPFGVTVADRVPPVSRAVRRPAFAALPTRGKGAKHAGGGGL